MPLATLGPIECNAPPTIISLPPQSSILPFATNSKDREVTLTRMRKLISSGSPYEPKVGISRAVRVGPIITVAGTAPLGPDGRTVGHGDAGAQARRCLEIISAALEKAGASMANVVRTRILLTRIEDWQAVAAVHGEFFRDIRPVNTIMQISRFIDPDWLVEIEADAVVDISAE
jgi:enamine deaminase RidA (YjgF/YER057c/UK114 family)